MIVSAPLIRPDAPAPAIALATINILEFLANAHKSEPSSKTPRKVMKLHCQKVRILMMAKNSRRLTLEL